MFWDMPCLFARLGLLAHLFGPLPRARFPPARLPLLPLRLLALPHLGVPLRLSLLLGDAVGWAILAGGRLALLLRGRLRLLALLPGQVFDALALCLALLPRLMLGQPPPRVRHELLRVLGRPRGPRAVLQVMPSMRPSLQMRQVRLSLGVAQGALLYVPHEAMRQLLVGLARVHAA